MSIRPRPRLAALALSLLGVGLVIAPVQAQAAEITCRSVFTPVTLAGARHSLHGTLCVPDGATTVQVLIPGSSYNSAYWDFPYTPGTRSFRLAMNEAGIATMAVDRLGTGRSSRPPSLALTAFTQAGTIHQLVTALRAGQGTPTFEKVLLGGHSLGSAIAIIEAGTYRDVDGVLVTGLTHLPNVTGLLPVLSSLVPAALDPKFAGKVTDLGYLTTRSNTRYRAFHFPGANLAPVVAADEATKDVFSAGEIVDGALIGSISPYSLLIDAPVMVAMGQDPTSCGLLSADCSTAERLRLSEAPYYAPAARLHTFVLTDFGHSINLAPDAPRYQQAVVDWVERVVV